MSVFSSSAAGWRLVFRRPAIPLAEIAWRWSVAAAFWSLLFFLLIEYASTLPVRNLDRFLLSTGQPVLAWIAAGRIFSGSVSRFNEAIFFLGIAITAAWIVLASVGRSATLGAMMQELGIACDVESSSESAFSLAGLNLLRALIAFATFAAAVGAFVLLTAISRSTRISPGGAGRLWIALLCLLWMTWLLLNWVLSVAAIFVVKDSLRVFPAISATLYWWGEKLGAVFAAGTWFGLARTGAFMAACGAFFIVLGLGSVAGPGVTFVGAVFVIASYCAVADFIYIGRMAAYISMFREEPGPASAAVSGILPHDGGSAAVDKNELILSDTPLPAN